MIYEKKIIEFLDELSSSAPTPGGGSAAALSGAISAGLLAMVCNLTIEKREYIKVKEKFQEILSEVEKIKHNLLKLVDDDSEAFNEVIKAYKMPKDTNEQKTMRKMEIQTALKHAVEPPMSTMENISKLVGFSVYVYEKGNMNTVTDLSSSVLLAYISMEIAYLNVKINLLKINDEKFVNEKIENVKKIFGEAKYGLDKTLNVIDKKIKDSHKNISEVH